MLLFNSSSEKRSPNVSSKLIKIVPVCLFKIKHNSKAELLPAVLF
jgi:hypothetical protein